VPPNSPRRKVLIVEGEPTIRNVLFVLLAGLGCDGDVAADSKQALSMLRKERFDAVLLDLRSSHLPPEEMFSSIIELRPTLVGRVLVIVGEVADPATMATLERCAVPHISLTHMASELRSRIRLLPGFAPGTTETPTR